MTMLTDWLRGIGVKLKTLLRPDAAWKDLDDEVRFHLEMEAARLRREGLAPEEARRQAMLRFGGVERIKDETREARGTKLWEDMMQDLKYGLRMIVKNPVFSAVAIITLALGIGANTAIYTVVKAVLLDPLPFEESEELTLLWTRNDEQNQDKYMVSPMDFDDWRTMNTTFESMAAFWPTTGTVTEDDGNPTRVRVVHTTEDFFTVMGVLPLSGRAFREDDGPGSTAVAVLSHGFWQRRFGGDPAVIGQSITLDGGPIEVIGIVRPEHTFPDNTDMWINMTWTMQIQSRQARWMSAIGRLNDADALGAARTDLVGVAARIEQANPDSNRGWTVTVAKLHDEIVGDTRTALLVLLGATGFILLIACANVANLLLSRSEVRAKEIAVRVAFGAGRGRLIKQLVTESLVLAGAGALLGLAGAQVGVRVLLSLAPVTLPRAESIQIDGTVLGVVAGVSLLTGVLFGLAPIVRLLQSDLQSTIRDGARSTGSAGKQKVQNAFVVAQFAMALMLAVGAGLLVRSFQNLRSVDPGFVPSGVLTLELDVSTSVAPGNQEVIDFYEQFERRIAELPGVLAVGDASSLPLGEALDYSQIFSFVDKEVPPEVEVRAFNRLVSPGFLSAMRTPIIAGRDFNSMDRVGSPGAVLINETLANRFFPGEDPIGEKIGDVRTCYGPLGCLHVAGDIQESEIVGVVRDVKYDGLRVDAQPGIYFSGMQSSIKRRTIVVRSTSATSALLPAIRQELASMNPSVALTNVQSLDDVVADAQSRDRFSALLLSMFGIVALLLASVGVYGVLAYTVEQRTSELGIRMALGADRGDVRGMVLSDGLRLVLVGLGVGIVGAIAVSGVISSQLYGVNARDPVIYGGITASLLLVGLTASFVPAWRATRVSPLVAMRSE
ncbi:MAG: ABC transporter permease [Gemmatimonadetes bacterium]|nr:ABC transporter permease [Gemmatimonadota bacterium]MCH8810289.1 ABC transporter permease [Gemmatimonadota bacterium]